jgi:DNA-binding NarL/FixJ family response regulator
MLSSSDDERDLRAAYQNGANSYLRKSVSAQRLNDALAALVSYWCGFHEQVGAE